ncbi:MAG: sigma-70 family RNA polymerase sigma factor [Bacteroidota bacterium]
MQLMIFGRKRDDAGSGSELSVEARRRFDVEVLPHLDAGYNLARHIMRDAEDAEDMVQEAFLRAIRHFAGFRGGDGRPWLLAIVRNVCFTELRRRRAAGERIVFDEEQHTETDAMPGPEVDLDRKAAADSLDAALARLPVEFREALVLRELEEMSYKEIAQITGVPVGTVMSRLARARERLARALGVPGKEVRDGVS